MKILVCYKNISNIPEAASEIFSDNGYDCVYMRVDKAEVMRSYIRKNAVDAVLSSEITVLSRCNVDGVAKIYISADYSCTQKLDKPECELYLVPSKELSFDFINSGAKDKKVVECGIPVRKKYRNITDKESACIKLGIDSKIPVFTVFTGEATKGEIKATVRSALSLCEGTQVLVAVNTDAEKTLYSTVFSENRNVFVYEASDAESLCISASDAVFTVANAEIATAVSRMRIPLLLIRSPNKTYKENSRFFDKRGIGFEGKTAADNVSYAGRLLKSQRLRDNMKISQNKFIQTDSEERLFEKISTFLENLR